MEFANALMDKLELNGSQDATQLVQLASQDKLSRTVSALAHQAYSRPTPVLVANVSSQHASQPNLQISSQVDAHAQQARL